MFRSLGLLLWLTYTPGLLAQAQSIPASGAAPDREPVISRRVWYASLAALAVANTLDIHSSLGKRERNPLLAGPDGRFTTRGSAIKIGIQVPFLVYQLWFHKRHARSFGYKAFAASNFAVSGSFIGASARNYGIPQPELR
jgi:hypothetical protein